ncbi:MAG: hypothetical protein ABSE90_09220 [Verrucomicrobiota bacterium]|jgi:hypothetical protein
MEIKFNCDKADLIGAYLAGLGEDPKIKLRRIVFILMPLLVMIVIAICYQHFFHVEALNTILLPIILFAFAALYLWGVNSNRHYRAKIIVGKQLKEKGETMLGEYRLKIQDDGLEVIRKETYLSQWKDIQSIEANGDYCQIRIPGKDDIIIASSKLENHTAFELFVRLCVTMHYYKQRGLVEEPVKEILKGDVWDSALTKLQIGDPSLERLQMKDEEPSRKPFHGKRFPTK